MTTRPEWTQMDAVLSIVRRMDRFADDGRDMAEFFEQTQLDGPALIWLAEQRTLRAHKLLPDANPALRELGIWFDAFALGVLYGTRDTGFLPEDPGPTE